MNGLRFSWGQLLAACKMLVEEAAAGRTMMRLRKVLEASCRTSAYSFQVQDVATGADENDG
jgi:hypothetical protein